MDNVVKNVDEDPALARSTSMRNENVFLKFCAPLNRFLLLKKALQDLEMNLTKTQVVAREEREKSSVKRIHIG